MRKGIMTVMVMLLWGISIQAQLNTIIFETIDEDAGLPNNTVRIGLQDRSGTLWFGSLEGLVKFDGFEYDSYRTKFNDSTSLSGNQVSALFEDDKGRLWAGTYSDGLNYSDPQKEHFNNFNRHAMLKDILSSRIFNIAQDSLGYIWIIGNKGLHILRETQNDFFNLDLQDYEGLDISEIQNASPSNILVDHLGRIWVGTQKGIYLLDLRADKSLLKPSDANFNFGSIQFIAQDLNRRVWFSSSNQDYRIAYFDEILDRMVPFDQLGITPSRRSINLLFDKDNRLWAPVMGDQVYGYDFRDSTIFLRSHENSNIDFERFINFPFVDNNGNVWLSGPGYYKFDYPKGFNHFQHVFEFSQSFNAVYETETDWWFSIRSTAVIKVDKATQKQTKLDLNTKGWQKVNTDHVSKFLTLRDGRFAMVGMSNLTIYDEKSESQKSIRLAGSTRDIIQDSRGILWIGGFDGLIKISEDGEVLRKYTLPIYKGERRNFIQAIQEDKNGDIWFGSSTMGLSKLIYESDSIVRFLPVDPLNENSIRTINIIDIVFDQAENLWLGTDKGLVKMDIVNETFNTYTIENGLLDDLIASVLIDKQGVIWMSTGDGISALNPFNNLIKNYVVSDGLINNSYRYRSKFYRDGVIYFGGTHGLDYFKPGGLRPNLEPLQPKLLSIRVKGKSDPLTSAIDECNPLHLHYKDDLLEIEFGATHFITKEKIEYAYRMEGLIDEWRDLKTKRQIIFSDLKSGEYVCEIRAREKNKEWSERILSFPIVVSTPFWQTTWFRLLAAIAFLYLTYQLVKYREKRSRKMAEKKAAIESEMLKLEKQALLAQMNPHFMFNSMNAIQQFMAEKNYEGAMTYLSKFSRLLRSVLKISSKNKVLFSEEMEMIKNYLELERYRYPNRFDYEIELKEELDLHDVKIPSFLIQPQVEYAIQNCLYKNSDKGIVKILAERKNGQINISIEDNGVSRMNKNGVGEGYQENTMQSLSIVEERLKYINRNFSKKQILTSKIVDDQNNNIGTRVELNIDIHS